MSSSTMPQVRAGEALAEGSSLRLLYICDFPPSEEDGGRILLKRLLQRHPPENISVFTTSAALRTSPAAERLQCRHVGFPIFYRSRNWLLTRIRHALSWLMVAGISLAATFEIRRRKVNIVLTILHGRLYFAAAAAGALTSTPYIVFVHDDRVSPTQGATCFWRRVGKPLTGLVLRHAAHVYAVSPGMQSFLRAEFDAESEVQWPATAAGGRAPARHLPEPGTLTILFAGGIHYANQDSLGLLVDLLLSGMLWGSGIPPLKLHICTRLRECPPSVLSWAGPGISIRDWLPQAHLGTALRQADILFLPYSFREHSRHAVETAFPSKIADYLAASKPILVLAPPYSTLARYAGEEHFAELVTEFDQEALAAALRNLALSAAYRNLLARRALEVLHRNHDISRQRRQFYELISRMHSRGKRLPWIACLALLACLSLPAPRCSATDIYFAQNASGVGNGSDCANAYAYSFFNTRANWGTAPGQIGPGATAHICGTVTTFNGVAYDYLRFHGSGTQGQPITLKWEPGARLSVPSCGPFACVQMGGSYQVIDGGSNGILEATANGTGLRHHDPGAAIYANPCNYCEFKNLHIHNIYVHAVTRVDLLRIVGDGATATATCSTICGFSIGAQAGIANNSLKLPASVTVVGKPTPSTFAFKSTIRGIGMGGVAWDNGGGSSNGLYTAGTGVSIHHNTCHDVHWCCMHSSGAGSSVEIYRNKAWRMDHGVAIGNNPGSRQDMQSISVHDNEFYDPANWDTYSYAFHHDGIHIYLLGGLTVSGPVLIYNNFIHGNWGATATAYIFAQGSIPHLYIFNNLLVDEKLAGAYKIRGGDSSTHFYVFNNLFLLGVPPGNSYSHVYFTRCASMLFANNIIVRAADSGVWMGDGTGPFRFAQHGVSGNVYHLMQGAGNNGAWRSFHIAWTKQFSAWVAGLQKHDPAAGGERNSTLKDPFLSSDYHLRSGSSAIAIGMNLASLGIPQAMADRDGNPRPAVGAWDAGPYNFSALPAPAHATMPGSSQDAE